MLGGIGLARAHPAWRTHSCRRLWIAKVPSVGKSGGRYRRHYKPFAARAKVAEYASGACTRAYRVATLHKPPRKPLQTQGVRRRLWGRISSCGRFSIGPRADACHKGLCQRRSDQGASPALGDASAFPAVTGSDTSERRSLAGTSLAPQTSRRACATSVPLCFQQLAARFVESVAAARTSACATPNTAVFVLDLTRQAGIPTPSFPDRH